MMYLTIINLLSIIVLLTESYVLHSSERLSHFAASERASKYHLTIPVQLAGNNTPLQTLSTLKSPDSHLTSTRYRIQRDNQTEWILGLQLNNAFISKNFKLFYYDEETGQAASSSHFEHCFYHGQLEGLEGSSATINTCNQKGISGMIFDGVDLYHIEKSPGEQSELHMVYKSEDKLGEIGTCGVTEDGDSEDTRSRDDGQHPITHDWSAQLLRRKRDITEKFVEFFLIIDNHHYVLTGSNLNYTTQYGIAIANHMDFAYKSIGVRIALVGLEVWNTADRITVVPEFNDLLNKWINFLSILKAEKQLFNIIIDNAHLLTGISNPNTSVIGRAHISSMCFSRSGGVNRDTNGYDSARVGSTLAHEMGHNFGMNHDDGFNCNDCSNEPSQSCIMSAILRSPAPTRFSQCSIDSLESNLDSGVGFCIYNMPDVLFEGPACGNGYVEENETCDCGTPEQCSLNDPCCNPNTCTLFSFANCSTSSCCDNCSFSPQGKLCRSMDGICDIPDYCTGTSGICPDNSIKQNGLPCITESGNTSYCYNGVCRTHNDECRRLWGEQYGVGGDVCFEENKKGDRYGNCGYVTDFIPCLQENIMCGKLHCNIPSIFSQPIIPGDLTITTNIFGNQTCRAIIYNIGDVDDPGLVRDGVKCADGRVCAEGVCTNVTLLPRIPCPKDANGTECAGGFCDNFGVCIYPTTLPTVSTISTTTISSTITQNANTSISMSSTVTPNTSTSTLIPSTATPNMDTSTLIPSTATPNMDTSTLIPSTATPNMDTSTLIPSTATSTLIPSTATSTLLPSTIATSTLIPSTTTPNTNTSTPNTNTSTLIPSTTITQNKNTSTPNTNTSIPIVSTVTPNTNTNTPTTTITAPVILTLTTTTVTTTTAMSTTRSTNRTSQANIPTITYNVTNNTIYFKEIFSNSSSTISSNSNSYFLHFNLKCLVVLFAICCLVFN